VQFTQVANTALTATPQAQVRYPPECLFNEFISTGPGCEIERMSGGVAVLCSATTTATSSTPPQALGLRNSRTARMAQDGQTLTMTAIKTS
jgi:hypothetical protein